MPVWPHPDRFYSLAVTCADGQQTALGISEWGPPDSACVLFCVHGILQSAAFFSAMGYFFPQCRVVAVDMPGHGASFDAPIVKRTYARYAELIKATHRALQLDMVHYLGVSMGGVLGYLLMLDPAAQAWIRDAVIVDIAPVVSQASVQVMQRLDSFFRTRPAVPEAITHIVEAPGVPYLGRSDVKAYRRACWQHLLLPLGPDSSRVRISPRVFDLMADLSFYAEEMPGFFGSWTAYTQIRTPHLLMRGGLSTLVTAEMSTHMQAILPQYCTVYEVPNADHVPLLCTSEEAAQLSAFWGDVA